MRLGTQNFVGKRLVEAREARGLTATALAELAQLSRQAISQYENDEHSPSPEVLRRLSTILAVPESRFVQPIVEKKRSTVFARSMSSATKMSRLRASRALDRLHDVASYMESVTGLPPVDLPSLGAPKDPLLISMDDIEGMAADLRKAWGLGDGPISNMTWLLENHGIVVSRISLHARTMDGVSCWYDDRPFVLVNEDVPCARARFDLGHELGHLVMHRDVGEKALNDKALFKLIETQAHRFGAAFMFPQAPFMRETVPMSLDRFVALKSRWRVSVKMMIHRAGDLRLVSEDRLTQLYRAYGWRKWTQNEPLDKELPQEQSRLLEMAIATSLANGLASEPDLLHAFGLHGNEVTRFAGSERETLMPAVPPPQPLMRLIRF